MERLPLSARRLLLLILDGWGYRTESFGNLIAKARTPFMDELLARFPHAILAASGEAVGLPAGTVGNSEAGHLHIGAGRLIYSDRVRIDRAIADGSFYTNPAFLKVMKAALQGNKALHLMGIVSFFSSHGSLHHLFALLETAPRIGLLRVYIHAMLGRRGEQPESGPRYIAEVEKICPGWGWARWFPSSAVIGPWIGRTIGVESKRLIVCSCSVRERRFEAMTHQVKEGGPVMEIQINQAVLSLVQGDITQQDTDAIVNAANARLAGGEVWMGLSTRRGGRLSWNSASDRRLPHGPGGHHHRGEPEGPYVIHTVGPVYQGGTRGEANLLKSAYLESLRLASARGLQSIAFPAISTGVYSYPLAEAARIALKTSIDYLRAHDDLALVRFVLYDQPTLAVFQEELRKLI